MTVFGLDMERLRYGYRAVPGDPYPYRAGLVAARQAAGRGR